MKKELEFAELEFAANAGLWTKLPLTEQERDLLRLADKMELMFYCLEQRQMGNTHVGHVFWNLVNHLSELGAVEMAPEPAQEIFTYLIDSYPEGSECYTQNTACSASEGSCKALYIRRVFKLVYSIHKSTQSDMEYRNLRHPDRL